MMLNKNFSGRLPHFLSEMFSFTTLIAQCLVKLISIHQINWRICVAQDDIRIFWVSVPTANQFASVRHFAAFNLITLMLVGSSGNLHKPIWGKTRYNVWGPKLAGDLKFPSSYCLSVYLVYRIQFKKTLSNQRCKRKRQYFELFRVSDNS